MSIEMVFPGAYLQLVLAGLGLRSRVEEIDRENLFDERRMYQYRGLFQEEIKNGNGILFYFIFLKRDGGVRYHIHPHP